MITTACPKCDGTMNIYGTLPLGNDLFRWHEMFCVECGLEIKNPFKW
jgi:hypothetical protein